MFFFLVLESSPTKLSQQEEALLLDDEELLDYPPTDDTQIAAQHDESVALARPIDESEFRDDLVTTTTPEPTTSDIVAEAATPEHAVGAAVDVVGSSRAALKRTSDAQQCDADESTAVALGSKKLRVDAAEFVPARIDDSCPSSNANENNPDVVIADHSEKLPTADTSAVSEREISTDDEMGSSQKTTSGAETSVSLGQMADDEYELDAAEDAHQLADEPQSTLDDDGDGVNEAASSSTGMEESDSDFGGSRTRHRTGGALLALPEMETEDSDEGNERLNPKHHVERDNSDGAVI